MATGLEVALSFRLRLAPPGRSTPRISLTFSDSANRLIGEMRGVARARSHFKPDRSQPCGTLELINAKFSPLPRVGT